jgi:hypothetical protein
MQPGDLIEDGIHKKISSYHGELKNHSLYHLLDEDYKEEISASHQNSGITEADAEHLQSEIEYYANENKGIYSDIVLEDVHFAIMMNDLADRNFFNVDYVNGSMEVSRTDKLLPDRKLVLSTNSKLLAHSLSYEWGGDVLTIGYGMDVEVFEERSLEKNLDIVCVRLLSRFPKAFQTMIRQPFRTMKFFLSNPLLSKLYVKQKLMMRNTVNKYPYNERDHWISYSKCDLCQVCNMPLLSFKFGVQLGAVRE